tara:strand:- start:353 stop:706 length:354 start_codon:yes stop_codon:yes gene_type:complete
MQSHRQESNGVGRSMSLDLEQCNLVIQKINKGVPIKVIAKRFNVNSYDITLINRCKTNKYPLDEYRLIDDPDYKHNPINEKCKIGEPNGANLGSKGWDLRMSLRLAKLPMSKWAAAL